MRIDLDPIACDAHGLCAELLPELINLDDWGYPIVPSQDVPAATSSLSGGLVMATLGAPVPGTTLTVIDALDVPPPPLVALSVTVCVPTVAILYWSSLAPVPIGVPSSDHVADGPMSPCSGSIASPRKLIVWSLP